MRGGRKFARELRRYDWDAIVGIVAAGAALILHLLRIIEQEVLLTIGLVLLALLLIRDLRREERDERLEEIVARTEAGIARLHAFITPPDAVLFGPRQLRAKGEAFASQARGEMVWFNVCLLMFRPQSLFDALLRPAIENPAVKSIQFVLDESERERWRDDVIPKAEKCAGYERLLEPRWRTLRESVSFILADTAAGQTEAPLSFWGEPFMSRTTAQDIPRYIFEVQGHSELIPRLVELERSYRGR
ncbi:MAG: hypothetical protein C0506_02840 [Anaerolinea sp.]|nr:hypothetical protein [Anaerolinea sp.]